MRVGLAGESNSRDDVQDGVDQSELEGPLDYGRGGVTEEETEDQVTGTGESDSEGGFLGGAGLGGPFQNRGDG